MSISQFEHSGGEINKVLSSSLSLSEQQQVIKGKILDLLTTRELYFRQTQQGISPENLRDRYREQSDWYKRQQDAYENHSQGAGNPAWIQLNCYPGSKLSSGVNIKLYRSIPIREYAFISHLGTLKGLLEKLSIDTGDRISFKFPRGLIAFMKHQDSLVVHFQKKENIDSINQILDTWMKDNAITRQKREGNRSEIAADHSGMSFSELIAINFAHQMLQHPHEVEVLLKRAILQAQYSNIVLK